MSVCVCVWVRESAEKQRDRETWMTRWRTDNYGYASRWGKVIFWALWKVFRSWLLKLDFGNWLFSSGPAGTRPSNTSLRATVYQVSPQATNQCQLRSSPPLSPLPRRCRRHRRCYRHCNRQHATSVMRRLGRDSCTDRHGAKKMIVEWHYVILTVALGIRNGI